MNSATIRTESAVEIGVRDLRDGLSRHLAAVRDGQTITVTDHGRPIARIVPVDAPTVLERLIGEGRVTPARRRGDARPPDPLPTAGPVSELLIELRR